MPPAVAAAAIAGGAALGAGALGFAGAKSAQKAQDRASSEAIALAREQEAERKRQWEVQQQAAAYQWKVMQANLKPYRLARAAVLNKYGIDTNVEDIPMPEGFGMPGGPAPRTPVAAPRGGGGMGALAGVGMGLGAGSAALQAYLASRQFSPSGPGFGGSGGIGLGAGGPGYTSMSSFAGPMEPGGPPTSQIQVNPANLANWEDWNNYIGGD